MANRRINSLLESLYISIKLENSLQMNALLTLRMSNIKES